VPVFFSVFFERAPICSHNPTHCYKLGLSPPSSLFVTPESPTPHRSSVMTDVRFDSSLLESLKGKVAIVTGIDESLFALL